MTNMWREFYVPFEMQPRRFKDSTGPSHDAGRTGALLNYNAGCNHA